MDASNNELTQAKLSERKQSALSYLYEHGMNEEEIGDRLRVQADVVRKWIGQPLFQATLQARMASSLEQARIQAARLAPLAVAKLAQLMDCSKEETARKACLDLLAIVISANSARDKSETQEDDVAGISPQMASRLLAAMAEPEPQDS